MILPPACRIKRHDILKTDNPDTRLPVSLPYGIRGRDCPFCSGYRIKRLLRCEERDENGLYALSGCRDKRVAG